MTTLVLDTNIVLDVFVFADEVAKPLLPALTEGRLHWVATSAMRDELARVLDYPQIVPRLAYYELASGDVLAAFDRHAQVVEAPPKAPVTCSDPDDQKFIDLAVARQALLLSKDRAVLSMKKRLASWSVQTRAAFEPLCLES
jgi:putative PIN family toxin of toxin-antitoxin system